MGKEQGSSQGSRARLLDPGGGGQCGQGGGRRCRVSDGHEARRGARLRLARRARGLSQQQIANVAGVSRQAVSAVESGVTDPSLRAAIALARALGMTVEELFGRDDAAVPVTAIPVAPLGGTGARVTLAPVEDGYVALPLQGSTASRSGFLPAGGLTAEAGTGLAPGRKSGPSGRRGPPWSRRAAIRRCRCWRLRSGCLIRRLRSAGGRARAGKHSGWPPTDWCTSPGRTCAGRAASTTSARPLTCCPGAARCGEHIAALPPRPQRAPRKLAQHSGQPRPDHRK